MSNKKIFSSTPLTKLPPANTKNAAGGVAYSLSDKQALTQYAVTGTFNNTFYSNAEDQLSKVKELCSKVPLEFLAKLAIYSRQNGKMKDMPAFFATYIASKDSKILRKIFPKVIDNAKMLRNFVQMIRSGVCDRKSFGTAPKALIKSWFSSKTPEQIFKQSVGAKPSLADVIKLTRPSPKDATGILDTSREAFYGYLLGKEVNTSALPELVKQYELFKKDQSIIPNVPFEMLTALSLTDASWQAIAKNMSWHQLRMNLNTLQRHNVFTNQSMVTFVANKLKDREEVLKAKVLPYQLLATYLNTDNLPQKIRNALQDAMEVAVENVPSMPGKVYVAVDISGSMKAPATGDRGSATSKVRCIDVASLIASAVLRANDDGEVIPFHIQVQLASPKLNPRDSVMTNVTRLTSLPSGGTACSAPVNWLNRNNLKGDVVIIISDNESWADYQKSTQTALSSEWLKFKKSNPKAKLILVDLAPNAYTQAPNNKDILNIGGFSDNVFDLINLFINDKLSGDFWTKEVESISL